MPVGYTWAWIYEHMSTPNEHESKQVKIKRLVRTNSCGIQSLRIGTLRRGKTLVMGTSLEKQIYGEIYKLNFVTERESLLTDGQRVLENKEITEMMFFFF